MLDEAIEYLKQLQLQVQVSFLFQAMLFWVYPSMSLIILTFFWKKKKIRYIIWGYFKQPLYFDMSFNLHLQPLEIQVKKKKFLKRKA